VVSTRSRSRTANPDIRMTQNRPLAYHITFGTYGTRLHGDERGTIDRSMNRPGDPIIGRDDDWNRIERERLNFPPREFTPEQRLAVEELIPLVCERGKWKLYACAAAPDHVHVVLIGVADGDAIRKWLKRWLGLMLAKRCPLQVGQTFWAECGSVKWVWNPRYL